MNLPSPQISLQYPQTQFQSFLIGTLMIPHTTTIVLMQHPLILSWSGSQFRGESYLQVQGVSNRYGLLLQHWEGNWSTHVLLCQAIAKKKNLLHRELLTQIVVSCPENQLEVMYRMTKGMVLRLTGEHNTTCLLVSTTTIPSLTRVCNKEVLMYKYWWYWPTLTILVSVTADSSPAALPSSVMSCKIDGVALPRFSTRCVTLVLRCGNLLWQAL